MILQLFVAVQAAVITRGSRARGDSGQAAAILKWIQDAKTNAGTCGAGGSGGTGGGNPSCAPIDKFNAGLFRRGPETLIYGKTSSWSD